MERDGQERAADVGWQISNCCRSEAAVETRTLFYPRSEMEVLSRGRGDCGWAMMVKGDLIGKGFRLKTLWQ